LDLWMMWQNSWKSISLSPSSSASAISAANFSSEGVDSLGVVMNDDDDDQ
jgi:hypothetical protein